MIERRMEMVLESGACIWLFVLVWCAVLGSPIVPSWNSFVTWFGNFVPDASRVTDLFGVAIKYYNIFTVIDFGKLQAVSNGSIDMANLWESFGFLINIGLVGLPSIVMAVAIVLMFIYNVLVNIMPMVIAFSHFLAGDYIANLLPGVMPVIDWSSMSGWLGYPDPVLSSV